MYSVVSIVRSFVFFAIFIAETMSLSVLICVSVQQTFFDLIFAQALEITHSFIASSSV